MKYYGALDNRLRYHKIIQEIKAQTNYTIIKHGIIINYYWVL